MSAHLYKDKPETKKTDYTGGVGREGMGWESFLLFHTDVKCCSPGFANCASGYIFVNIRESG